jgi:hypothetical protein
MKTRGYVQVGAGLFLVAASVGLWILFGFFLAPTMQAPPQALSAFLGRLDTGFALLGVGGVLAALNGYSFATSGRHNRLLAIGGGIMIVAALVCFRRATAIDLG